MDQLYDSIIDYFKLSEMVKQEQEYSKIVDEESKIKNNSIVQSTNDFLT